MTQRRRLEQINKLVREEIGKILIHGNNDPILAAMTVIEVRVSPDLNQARVYVMVRRGAGDGEVDPGSEQGLRHAAEVVQRQLGPRIRLRKTPHVHFVVDDTEERAERIDKLLQEVKEDWQDAERDPEH